MLTSSRQRGAPQILQQHPVARDSFLFLFLFLVCFCRCEAAGDALNNSQRNKRQLTMMQGSAPGTPTFGNLVSLPVQLGRKECGFGELGQVQLLLRRKQQLD